MIRPIVKNASTFHGSNKQGYITAWQAEETHMSSLFNEIMPVYESVQSWPIYRTKSQAIDILRLIAIMAYVDSLEFEYTVYNTSYQFYSERDRVYMLLFTEDKTLMEYSDQAVLDLIDDGFIDPRNIHTSMVEYYNSTFTI